MRRFSRVGRWGAACWACVPAWLACAAADSPFYVTVDAGDQVRSRAIVEVTLPNGRRHFNRLEIPGEPPIPLQVDPDGRARFILPHLAARARKVLKLTEASSSPPREDAVQVTREGPEVVVRLPGGRKVLAYRADKVPPPRPDIKPIFERAGYLHPVWSPAGKVVTDDYPANHLHHHGIWFAYTKAEFEGRHPNFWEMGAGAGTVEADPVADLVSGPVWGGFVASHRFVDLTAPSPKLALTETWEVRVYRRADTPRACFTFDLTSVQRCASASPVKLPEYRYGGLGVRGSAAWDGKDRAPFLTSEGLTNRLQGNQSRARWCYLGGAIDGGQAGMAILCAPDNLRAPQPLRLNPEEPFLSYAPMQSGDILIAPGKELVARYRFLVFDGAPDPAWLDREWAEYAHPAEASFVMP